MTASVHRNNILVDSGLVCSDCKETHYNTPDNESIGVGRLNSVENIVWLQEMGPGSDLPLFGCEVSHLASEPFTRTHTRNTHAHIHGGGN